MKTERFLIIIGIVLALASCFWESSVKGPARVIDGDTLIIAGVTIRLHGIDAPEADQICIYDGAAHACGRDATLALREKIGAAPVTCVARETDRYGRTVAVCWANGDELNRWLVKEGYAVAYRRYSLDYANDEDAARSARLGIWAGEFQMPWEYRAKFKAR